MDQIPKPQVLDPDRPLRPRGTHLGVDERPREEVLDIALHESCAYAQQLWDQLDAIRTYLLDSLPPEPHEPGSHPKQTSASPTGPNDERGWSAWIDAFGAVSSVLCGAHGDDGLGVERAREAAQRRRTFPDQPDQVP